MKLTDLSYIPVSEILPSTWEVRIHVLDGGLRDFCSMDDDDNRLV